MSGRAEARHWEFARAVLLGCTSTILAIVARLSLLFKARRRAFWSRNWSWSVREYCSFFGQWR